MKRLISRAQGEIICNISDDDFRTVTRQLVRQSETSSGYYLNPDSLKLLDDIGISKAVIRALRRHMKPGGLDLGWEEESEPSGFTLKGVTLDSLGEPVGGIRIVLLSAGHKVLSWAYTRPNGEYDVSCSESVEARHVRFAGRGDLVLAEFAVGDDDAAERRVTRIDTLTGKLVSETGEPICGVSVQLLRWKEGRDATFQETGSRGGSLTWGDSDEAGQFVVPIRVDDDQKIWQAVLEVLAPSGQSLRKMIVTIRPNESLDLGHLVCPIPADEWGDEPVELKRSVVMYPGVSERPLS